MIYQQQRSSLISHFNSINFVITPLIIDACPQNTAAAGHAFSSLKWCCLYIATTPTHPSRPPLSSSPREKLALDGVACPLAASLATATAFVGCPTNP